MQCHFATFISSLRADIIINLNSHKSFSFFFSLGCLFKSIKIVYCRKTRGEKKKKEAVNQQKKKRSNFYGYFQLKSCRLNHDCILICHLYVPHVILMTCLFLLLLLLLLLLFFISSLRKSTTKTILIYTIKHFNAKNKRNEMKEAKKKYF